MTGAPEAEVTPVEYTDELVLEIARQNSVLLLSLRELRDVKNDPKGACLNYVAEHYSKARRAYDFLMESAPRPVREKLINDNLEAELTDFGNAQIRL